MDKMVALESYFKVSLEKELKNSSKLKIEDIAEIQKWMTTQPDLPLSPDIFIAHYLRATNYDMDVAKKAIKLNFEYRRSMTEFFDEWDPLSDAVQVQANEVAYVAFLPKKSPSQPKLCLYRFKENSAALFDYAHAAKWFLMSFSAILFLEGQQEFNIIIDAAPFTFAHVLKIPYRLVRNYNAYNTVQFHGTPEEYFDSIHPASVPQDYGGAGPTLESLNEENTKRVLEARSALIAFSEFK